MSAVGEDSFTPHDLESATAQRRKLRLQAQNYVPKPTLASVKDKAATGKIHGFISFPPSRIACSTKIIATASVVLCFLFIFWSQTDQKEYSPNLDAQTHRFDRYVKISYKESRSNSWVPFAPKHIILDAIYDENYHSVAVVYVNPGCPDHPHRLRWRIWRFFLGTKAPPKMNCVGDVFESRKSQSRVEHEHLHADVLICPLHPELARNRSSTLNFSVMDSEYDFIEPMKFEVEMIAETERRGLVACTSPLTNQGRFLPEWLEYHLLIGVEHFYVYVWDPDEELAKQLELYSSLGLVTVVDWTLPMSPGKTHLQPHAQMQCLYKFGPSTKWIMYNDVDEFFVVKKPMKTIPEALHALTSRVSQLGVNCIAAIVAFPVTFGPSQTFNKSNPDNLVVEHFTRSAPNVEERHRGSKIFADFKGTASVSVRILTQWLKP